MWLERVLPKVPVLRWSNRVFPGGRKESDGGDQRKRAMDTAGTFIFSEIFCGLQHLRLLPPTTRLPNRIELPLGIEVDFCLNGPIDG